MISTDAYRVSIGNFNNTRQLDLRSIYRHLDIDSSLSSRWFSQFLKASRLVSIALFLSILLISCGDIETNPGPFNCHKVVQASFNQGNVAIFGPQAGTQCMYMASTAIIYSYFKLPMYWEKSDLDAILRLGNELYRGLGYIDEYIDLTDLPSQLNIESNIIEFLRTPVTVSVLDRNSIDFLNPPPTYNYGIFVACSNGTAFMFDNGRYYVFDSHNRTSEGMCCYNNTGTSVLLEFNTKRDLEEYLKEFYLQQFRHDLVGFEVQYIKMFIPDDSLNSLKQSLRCYGYIEKRKRPIDNDSNVQPGPSKIYKLRSKTNKINFNENLVDQEGTNATEITVKKLKKDRTRKAEARAGETEREKQKRKNQDRLRATNARVNMSDEKKHQNRLKGRSQKATSKAKMTEEEKAENRNREKSRKAAASAKMTEEQKTKTRAKNRTSMAKARANLTEEQKLEIREKDRLRKAKRCANLTEEKKKARNEKDKKIKTTSTTALPHKDSMMRRVKTFKTDIRKGPFFICVICNRLMYRVSVILFNENKYHDVDEDVFSYRVLSFDNKEYICKTCDKKLLKKKVPPQAVANALQITNLPERFSDIRKLEKIIIAKRLLFKRITIMSKGQAPKMKGAICNVPIKADDICNILPRGMDNNGVVRVALKKKMSFKSNVYFEPVRPQFVREVLIYFKNNNPLYSDIKINLDSIPACWIDIINNDDQDETDDEIDFVREGESKETKPAENEEEEDNPLDHLRVPASETVLVPELPYQVIDDSNVTIAPGEDKKPLPIICDEDCEMLAHPHLFPTGESGYNHERDEKLSPTRYFNQRLLNYSLKFSSDSGYIFYAQSLLQHLNLNNSINTALKKIQTEGLTAGQLSQNFKETISNLVANDNAYSFMNNLKGTPAYWKRLLYEVLAMVKQLGLPTFFHTLSCADLKWPEIVDIIQKMKGKEMTEDQIRALSYMERTQILQSNPVVLARHFQYRLECYFKHIIAKGALGGKLKHHVIRIEFQARGSAHAHCLIWIENAPILTYETIDEYTEFVDKFVKCDFPEDTNSELYDLVKTYQIHRHSKSCRPFKNRPCRYLFGKFFTEKTIIAVPLDENLPNKEEILNTRKAILSPVKQYIDKNFDPRFNNVHDPAKENYREPKSINEILEELGIEKQVYYENLAISTDKSFQIHYKRSTSACFVNNYFEEGLRAWEANMDIQPVIDYHKCVSYMCAYISKSEDESTEAMKQAAKEALESNQCLREKMKSISRAYRTHREMSIQEAVSIVLPEIWLRRTSPAVIFANSNLPENRYRVCKSQDEISNMDEEDTNVFKKNMLDRYIDRPTPRCYKGKYPSLEHICYAEFLANYSLDSKNKEVENDYQPEILEEIDQAEAVDLRLPSTFPLKSNSKERLKLRKIKCVLRYHVPSREKKPERYAHHLLFMFYHFRNEEELKGPLGTYTEKLLSPEVLDEINRNKAVFEPFADVVDDAMLNFHENPRGYDIYGEQENDDVREEEANNASEEETDNEIENDHNDYRGGDSVQIIEPLISDDELNF
eukprot:TCONS_00041443-protein